jgi:hypothetical protein
LATLFVLSLGASAAPPLTTLQPGGFRVIQQDLPINIVFVGYEQGAGPRDIDLPAFMATLSNTYRPRVRTPAAYGVIKDLGLSFRYKYNVVFANDGFETAFFTYLNSIAIARPLSDYQTLYNGQTRKSLIVPNNATIDAHLVEQWLGNNSLGLLGVDTRQNTVFFIDWYGRAGFRHHTYTVQSVDPDTGFNWGAFGENQMIAFGGTAHNDPEYGTGTRHRIWFHDLSAGPEWNTVNWNVDDADFNSDGVPEYRMPPVWEYGNVSAYRPFTDLSGDLGKVTRYVALDLLFTSSPVYDPAISGPKLPKHVQVDLNVFAADPSSSFDSRFQPSILINALNALQPMNTFSVQRTEFPFSGRVADVWGCYFGQYFGLGSCYGQRLPFADLYMYYSDHLNQYLEGDPDYEEPVFVLHGTSAQTPLSFGFADDNWRDGTQSYVFIHVTPYWRQFLGYSGYLTHEVGHHMGLSHPHDGYDSESGLHFSPGNAFYFAWTGDGSNSAMSYQQAEIKDYSQFDQDNMHRWLTATYINEANRILGKVAASPLAGAVAGDMTSADGDAASALASYAGFNYQTAATEARRAYEKVLAAAKKINVPIEPQASQADYKSRGTSSKFSSVFDDIEHNYPRPGSRR